MTSVIYPGTDVRTNASSAWTDTCLAKLPGVLPDQFEVELFNTILTFLTRSGSWRGLVKYNVYANRDIIHLNPVGDNAKVNWIQVVWLSGSELPAYALPVPKEHPAGARGWYMDGTDSLRLVPTPSTGGFKILEIDASLIPITLGGELPDTLFTHWFDNIEAGVLSRFMLQHKKPWSNPTLGRVYGQLFSRGVAQALAMRKRGFTPGRRWSFRKISA